MYFFDIPSCGGKINHEPTVEWVNRSINARRALNFKSINRQDIRFTQKHPIFHNQIMSCRQGFPFYMTQKHTKIMLCYLVFRMSILLFFRPKLFSRGEGVPGLKFLERLIKKIYPVGQLFGRGLRPQTLWRRGGHAHFPHQKCDFFRCPKITISHHRLIDNSLMGYHKKFIPIGQKVPKYG